MGLGLFSQPVTRGADVDYVMFFQFLSEQLMFNSEHMPSFIDICINVYIWHYLV